MNLVPLKCPQCGGQIHAKSRDMILICEDCGSAVAVKSEGSVGVRHKIFAFDFEAQGQRVYMPFWKFTVDITIYSEINIGGEGSSTMAGRHDLYVCASDIPAHIAKQWNQMLTYNPPKANEVRDFGTASRLPAVMDIEDCAKGAEFLFLAHELEKAGVLQDISYEFRIISSEVLYIPFYYYNNQYYIGLSQYRRR